MKTTKYFEFRKQQSDRIWILDEWIERVRDKPAVKVIQEDGRMKLWGRIVEANNRYLRVILLEDGETVYNAFFDRDFK